jgi:hypothetical protein
MPFTLCRIKYVPWETLRVLPDAQLFSYKYFAVHKIPHIKKLPERTTNLKFGNNSVDTNRVLPHWSKRKQIKKKGLKFSSMRSTAGDLENAVRKTFEIFTSI